jgi:hypothetical protein
VTKPKKVFLTLAQGVYAFWRFDTYVGINIRSGWKSLLGTIDLAYLASLPMTKPKRFFNIDNG